MPRSDDSLVTLALVSRIDSGDTTPLRASEYWDLLGKLHSLEALTHPGARSILSAHMNSEMTERVLALVERARAVAFEVDRLHQSGIETLTSFDDAYPRAFKDRLGHKAPPVLHAVGDLSVLSTPGIGVVGSRNVSEEGAAVATASADAARRLGAPIVSGGARGVDQLAMNAAHDSSVPVVGVLADSLQRTIRNADTRRAVLEGRTVLCTPYAPTAPFSAGNAMGRNKLIYALANVTLVVASDRETGGTWSGAVEAIKARNGHVAIWRGPGEGPGNATLVSLGGTAISDIAGLDTLYHTAFDVTAHDPAQLTLL